VTAVAIGVLITKQLQARPEANPDAIAGDSSRPTPSLDAIRAAGF